MTWQSLFRVRFSHELFEKALFPLHCLTCTIYVLTPGSSAQVIMIVRPWSKSFTTGVDNLNVGRLTCLSTKYTCTNTDKYVCIHTYIHTYICT